MADLVSAPRVTAYLQLEEPDPVALDLADRLEAKLVSECNRTHRPFSRAQSARSERHDGTGRTTLWLDYPIAALTSVKLGYNVSSPDETLDVTDQTLLVWTVGSPKLERVDGRTFGVAPWPGYPPLTGYVTVVYDAAADLPDDAGLAVLSETARIFNNLGSEGLAAERIGGYSADYLSQQLGSPVLKTQEWQDAVAKYREIPV